MTKLEMIPVEPCKDINTEQEIDCEHCLASYDNNYKQRTCSMTPIGVQLVRCECGLSVRLPMDWTFFRCRRCNKKWEKDEKGWHMQTLKDIKKLQKAKKLKCQCGNEIPIGANTTERKCYNCNHDLVKGKDGKWERLNYATPKGGLTIGDVMKNAKTNKCE